MKAWIDPLWFEGDGMMVVHAETGEEAADLLGMDPDGMFYPVRCEAMDRLEGHSADVAAWALMIGVLLSDDCVRCGRRLDRADVAGTNTALVIAEHASRASRPVRVEGVGIFCTEECWRESAWAKRGAA